jgi:cytochrome c553
MRVDLQLRSRSRRWLYIAVLAAVAIVAAMLIFAWSGLYSVAASKGHWPPVKWLLSFGMQNSVKTHAMGITAPGGYSEDQVILGAGHYHGACATCHGAPGLSAIEAAKHMLPPPPDLAVEVSAWRDRELFWIVKNGIKYTGMPGWVAQQRDDEVWAVVAFLKRYPALDADAYRRLAHGQSHVPPQSGEQIATSGAPAVEAAGACGRCHGTEQHGPTSKLVPTLHGQPAEFLIAALEQFASGKRQSGIMQPIAAELAPDGIAKVAAYYAALRSPQRSQDHDDAAIARGRLLAERGDHGSKVPACAGCHGTSALPVYPRLAGQSGPYMRARLRLWKEGLPANSDTAAVMAPIARALTDEQIGDLSLYYASIPHAIAAGAARP